MSGESRKFDAGKPDMALLPYTAISHLVDSESKLLCHAVAHWYRHSVTGESICDPIEYLRLAIRPGVAEAAAAAFAYGMSKYQAPFTWGCIEPRRLVAAAVRHAIRFPNYEPLDPESGLPHFAHLAACAVMLLDIAESRRGG